MPGATRRPSFYIAMETLYVYNPDSGSMPVPAFQAGDEVPAEMLGPHGWTDKVKPAEPVADAAGKE